MKTSYTIDLLLDLISEKGCANVTGDTDSEAVKHIIAAGQAKLINHRHASGDMMQILIETSTHQIN